MGLPLPPPQIQWIDADGHPYAGGTVETYVPGTTTPKDTWQDEAQTILNTNPVVLDAAGRATILGDGDYRFIVRDVTGQLVYDGWTTSIVSAAMLPVVSAPTIADAVALLGISDMVQAETDRAEAAENALQAAITAETSRATGAENTLTTDLNNEISRAETEEANLQSQITAITGGAGLSVRGGYGTTSGSGSATISFSPAFSSYCLSVVATEFGPSWLNQISVGSISTSGATIYIYEDAGGGVPVSAASFYWLAVGA